MRVNNPDSRIKNKSLKIRKSDTVKIIAGGHKGQTGTVLSTDAQNFTVTIEGIGIIKRSVKPSQLNPRGGTKEIHRGLPISNVALIVDAAKGTTSRVGYSTDKDSNKIRVARALNNKEIK